VHSHLNSNISKTENVFDKQNVLFCCLVNDSSLRGGFLLNFLDDGQGMTQGNCHQFSASSVLVLSCFMLHMYCC